MAIAYRTNSASKGQFYVGSGPHLTAQGDNFIVTWIEGDYFDIEYVAFFKSAEAAETYYNDLHP